VTTDPGGDFNPSLIQDEQGAFHLAWFRWEAPFRGHIWYNRSEDGLTWNPANEVQVTTTPDVDDWVPTLARATDGSLLVWFAAAKRSGEPMITDLFVARKAPGAAGWTAAVPAAGLNGTSEHDHLPFAARVGPEIALVWVRHDDSQALPWLNPKSDVWLARSADGLSWSPPAQVTADAGSVVNLFPGLFPDEDGAAFVNWLSTRQGEPQLFQVPLAQAGRYPEGVFRIEGPGTGYSHRLTPTITPGAWIAVWVSGREGSQDVHYRFFERD
jgi:hypothetical protein